MYASAVCLVLSTSPPGRANRNIFDAAHIDQELGLCDQCMYTGSDGTNRRLPIRKNLSEYPLLLHQIDRRVCLCLSLCSVAVMPIAQLVAQAVIWSAASQS
ncbi:hypothetical protein N658DRAFT_113116 [Parathielavia hyrcaniae]|uniref:Uncharacterized protein n=1 Tax=Parathielavia hyrcaniae TaxID=113614 RepID=A0AAN6Q805_9PEZI|nr:hypothetical protein N658DRAFT_113116 [Parathielavia hyrcaniae]